MTYNDEDELAPVNYNAGQEIQLRGQAVGNRIMAAVKEYEDTSPRTLQSVSRQLGMSEVGGCREYIRATVQGDPKGPVGLKWSAFVGRAVGDAVETAVKDKVLGARTQTTVTVNLTIEVGGVEQVIQVDGHTDIVMGDVVDLKTRDGLEEVRRQGPRLKEVIQISGYYVASLEAGQIEPGSIGILAYLDRSGGTSDVHTFAVDERMARMYLKLAESRLGDVGAAMAAGVSQDYLRDEPESQCHYWQCPFRMACWPEGVYQPTEEITNPLLVDAIDQYVRGRDMAKVGKELQDAAKAILNPTPDEPEHQVRGVTARHSIKWTSRAGSGGRISDSIDVRERAMPVPKATSGQSGTDTVIRMLELGGEKHN